MVVDTSVLLAVFFDQPDAAWAVERLEEYSGELCMSTVNLAETLILVRDRAPRRAREVERHLLQGAIRFVAPDVDQARLAVEARLRFPLNLGDCFAYALARVENCPVLTLDRDFRRTDRPVVMP